MSEPEPKKRMLEYNGNELKERAKSRRGQAREDALGELERRRNALRDCGVIPEWELEARGPNIDEWELV